MREISKYQYWNIGSFDWSFEKNGYHKYEKQSATHHRMLQFIFPMFLSNRKFHGSSQMTIQTNQYFISWPKSNLSFWRNHHFIEIAYLPTIFFGIVLFLLLESHKRASKERFRSLVSFNLFKIYWCSTLSNRMFDKRCSHRKKFLLVVDEFCAKAKFKFWCDFAYRFCLHLIEMRWL